METYDEFKRSLISKPKNFKVTNSWGVYDYFKYYRKHRPKDKKFVVTEGQYYRLIRLVNKRLADEFVEKHYLELPCRMGEIEVLQAKNKSYIKDGKVKTNRVVDWDETLKLWYEDKELYEKKQLVYHDVPIKPKFRYIKTKAMFTNRAFYEMKINQDLMNRACKSFNDQLLCFDNFEIKNLYDG